MAEGRNFKPHFSFRLRKLPSCKLIQVSCPSQAVLPPPRELGNRHLRGARSKLAEGGVAGTLYAKAVPRNIREHRYLVDHP
jgi:hypothetical protein